MYSFNSQEPASINISVDRFTIRLDNNVVPFSEFEGGASEQEMDRWVRYVDLALRTFNRVNSHACTDRCGSAANPPRQDSRFDYDTDGSPLLPGYNPSWNMAEAAEILSAWFDALWGEYMGAVVATKMTHPSSRSYGP